MGLGDYSDTFPKPTSGKSIATGEKFDTVGGVFLAARAEPYVYKAGGGEIDGAVATVLNLRIKQNLMRAVSHTGPSGCRIICTTAAERFNSFRCKRHAGSKFML